jgi:hypothetical protein
VLQEQKQRVEAERAAIAAKQNETAGAIVRAGSTAVARPDTRSDREKYFDEIAPVSIAGQLVKFTKEGKFVVSADGTEIDESKDFIFQADQTLIGYVRFNQEGPPDRVMGLLYEGFVMPPRETLGDLNESTWELGLDGKPADPWQHHVYAVLQDPATSALYTFDAASKTARRAVGVLLRHYDRQMRTHPDTYPVVRLKRSGFNHRDQRVGWVHVPAFAVVGRAPKDSAVKPNTSPSGDLNDEIPFD